MAFRFDRKATEGVPYSAKPYILGRTMNENAQQGSSPREPDDSSLESGPPQELRMDIAKEIDTRGLNCPLPILKAKKALADMQAGQLLKVVATDAGSVRDFQAFARQTGNELVEQQTAGQEFIHILRRR